MKKPNNLYAISISLLLSIATISIYVSNRSIGRTTTTTTTSVVSRQHLPQPSTKQQFLHNTPNRVLPARVISSHAGAVPPEARTKDSSSAAKDALVKNPKERIQKQNIELKREKESVAKQDQDGRTILVPHGDSTNQKELASEKQALQDGEMIRDLFQAARQNYGQKIEGAPAIPVGILSEMPYSFFQKLQNDIDQSDPNDRCRRYKGTYNPKRNRRIFYGALAASEPWELLEIITTEAHGIFAGVVIVESNRTQNFTPRPFLRLAQEPTLRILFGTDNVTMVPYVNEIASNQLLQAIASGISNQVEIDNHYLAREHRQRGEIARAWRAQGMTVDDVGLLVDMDEMLTRDFLRAIQQCDDIDALHYERHHCDHRKVKLVTVTHTFETSPECITAGRRGFHPDLVIGACIEGIGNSSLHPNAPREEETFLRKQGFGGGDCDWSQVRSISKQGFYPLWDMSDFRRTCGGGMLGIDTKHFPAYAEYSAYHFHNFFTDFNATRFKMATYGHPKAYAMTRGLEFLSNDLKMMYRCVKGIPDAKRQKWKRVNGGFRAVKPFMPIYFQDPDYRRRRHASVKELVELDELYMKNLKDEHAIE